MKKVLIIGDLHLPFHDASALKKIYDAVEKEKPRIVIQIGDLLDLFSMSRFPKSPDVITPKEELEEGRRAAEALWKNVKQRAPDATCYQLLGNHCIRPKKIIIEKCPELLSLLIKSWEDLFKFKGVTTIFDTRDDLEIDGIVYEHGFFGRPGQHMKENMKPTVIGHTHRPWLHYEKIRKELLWELNVGYVADPTNHALSYPRKKWVKWCKGYGLIDQGIPSFIPLE